jgi:hypothetical protein
MELIPAETSLVVAGAWNAAILTPGWVMQHAFQKPLEEQGRVQVFLPALQGAVFEFPRYVLDNLAYIVRPDALVVAPNESSTECFGLSEDAVTRIVSVLSHTPITGIGHNFEFRDQNPTPASLAVFTAARQDLVDEMPQGWSPTGAAIVATFKDEAESVHVNVQRQWDGAAVTVKFNFHHPVSSCEQARAVLEGANGYRRMADNLELAQQLINKIYSGGIQE